MTDTQEDKRSKRLALRLNSSILDRFEQYASQLGIAPSTLGALVIGEYVRSQDRQVENISAFRQIFPEAMQDVFLSELAKLEPFLSDADKRPEDASEMPFADCD